MEILVVVWVLTGGAVLTAAAGFAWARNIPDGERLSGGSRLLYAGYAVARGKRALLRRLRADFTEEAYYREMYVNESPGAKRMQADCLMGTTVILLMVALAAALMSSAAVGGFAETRLQYIERPSDGTGITNLSARYRGREYDISLAVTEKQMTSEELLAAAAEAEEKMLTWILGENESAEQVTESLIFPERVPGTPIELSWSTSDYRIVDYAGDVHPEYCGEDGEIVTLTALMTYLDWEETMQIPVRVCRLTDERDRSGEKLTELIDRYAGEQAYRERIQLPTEYDGSGVEFYQPSRFSPWMFILYAALLGAVIFLVQASRRRKSRSERQRQLLRDYPEVVSKLTLLMEAGSTIRLAWERIVDDYVRHREKTREYVYEEMLHTRNRISLGVSEEVAYEEFGRSCGNIRYLRLSSVLVQNLRKGSSGVLPLLRKEAAEAYCDRREQAKQRGEEAGTKLLLPMAGILVVILSMVLISAFMSL